MSVFRPLYDWALRQAEKPYATALLFLIALTEPCVFLVPPDVLLIPMAVAYRKRAFRLATYCLVGVLLGSLAGYGIGALAMDTLGEWIKTTYHLESSFNMFQHVFDKWGFFALIAKGFLPVVPIPLIMLIITSGVVHFNLALFLVSVGLSQGARLFFEAWLIHRYGEPVRQFIERYLTWIGLAIIAVILGCAWLVLCH